MAIKTVTFETLTTQQRLAYLGNSELLSFWRSNPVQASIDLLGFQPLDFQALMLTNTWFAQYALWCITRNGSKSMLGGVYLQLNSMLFENMKIFIVSSVGQQAKETFGNIERISQDNVPTIKGLKDYYSNEINRSNDSLTGFKHSPSGYEVELLNGSYIKTMNSIADNNRGRRANIVFLDECAFMPDEAVIVTEAFTTTQSSFQTSTEEFFNPYLNREKRPAQLIYASSASDKTTYFWKKYNDFAKRMWAGDRRYFVVDINVTVPLNPTLHGKPYFPLLDKSKPDAMMATNPTKCLREFFNFFDDDGGQDQIIKGHTIVRNSTFTLPEVTPEKGSRYLIAYDPASLADNAILGIMKICYDETRGTFGKLVNMINFKDLSDKVKNKQMLYPEQVDEIRNYISLYNGENVPEYQNIHKISIDAGMGGGGHLYSHTLMYDWKDKLGINHRGVIDKEYFEDKLRDYPNAYPILRMVEPTKQKPIIVGRLIDLMDLGLIEFPIEYRNSGHVDIEVVDESTGESEITRRNLSKEEELALANIDLCKEETKMIHRYKNANGTVSYKTRTDVSQKIHDDRFYVLALLASEIHEIREKETALGTKQKKEKTKLPSLYGKGTANSSH